MKTIEVKTKVSNDFIKYAIIGAVGATLSFFAYKFFYDKNW
jgi:hypothetical protein